MKKISIITINYNNTDGLRRTIESVVAQTSNDYEFVVIDGGSADGSVDVIRKYADKIDYWVSEPDGGIYPAMNKGVRAAHGEYCIFMNSGDEFYNERVLQAFVDGGYKEDIICGDLNYGRSGICPSPDEVTMRYLYKTTMYHQASFIKTDILRKIPYCEDMKVSGDWKFFFDALIMHNCSYRHLPVVVAIFEDGGYSSHNMGIAMAEKINALRAVFPERVLTDLQDYSYGNSNYRYMVNKVSEIPPVKRIVYLINYWVLKALNMKMQSRWIKKLTSNPDSVYKIDEL